VAEIGPVGVMHKYQWLGLNRALPMEGSGVNVQRVAMPYRCYGVASRAGIGVLWAAMGHIA